MTVLHITLPSLFLSGSYPSLSLFPSVFLKFSSVFHHSLFYLFVLFWLFACLLYLLIYWASVVYHHLRHSFLLLICLPLKLYLLCLSFFSTYLIPLFYQNIHACLHRDNHTQFSFCYYQRSVGIETRYRWEWLKPREKSVFIELADRKQ